MPTETVEMTAEDLGAALRIDKGHAYGLIRFGEERGWITKIGTKPSGTGRGRGATIYKIPKNLGNMIQELWAKAWWPKE
jgi:hypothetical protein